MKGKTLFLFGVAVLSVFVAARGLEPAVQSTSTNKLLIVGATLIDGSGAAPLPGSAILIQGNKIAAVGKAGEVKAPAGATVIDASGKFIIPGLIDAHVHYRGWTGELFLAHGVTSVFDAGNPTDWILAIREATARGLIRGPRLYVSGNVIEGAGERMLPRGSMGGGSSFRGPNRSRPQITEVHSVEEARKETRALIDREVDFIKVYRLPSDQLAAVVDQAHRSGLVVFGHVDTQVDTNAISAARAGIDGIAHSWGIAVSSMNTEQMARFNANLVPFPYSYLKGRVLPELIRTLVAEEVYVNPLLINEHASLTPRTEQHQIEVYNLLSKPELQYVPLDVRLGLEVFFTKVRNYAARFGLFPPLSKLPPEVQEDFRSGYVLTQQFVRDFVRAGGKLFIGTDAGGASVTPGLSLHHEMELLVDSGLTPMQVIQFATKVPAEMIGKGDEIGTVEPNKLADLIIIDGDPLADISNTKKISAVIKEGVQIDTSYHRDYQTFFYHPSNQDYRSSSFNRVPAITEITPKSTAVGSSGVTLKIRGGNFVLMSIVSVASKQVEAQFISPAELEVVLPPELFRSMGTLPVRVSNPRPGGGESNLAHFVVAPR